MNAADRPGIAVASRHWILEDKKLHASGLSSLQLAQDTDKDVVTHGHDAQQFTQISTPAAMKTSAWLLSTVALPDQQCQPSMGFTFTHAERIYKAGLLACHVYVALLWRACLGSPVLYWASHRIEAERPRLFCTFLMACVVIPSSPSFSASSTTSSAIFLWLFLRLPSTFSLACFIWLSASDSPVQLLKGDFMAVGYTPCTPMPGMATPPGSAVPSCATLVSPTSARQ